MVDFSAPSDVLVFRSTLLVDHSATAPQEYPLTTPARTYPFAYGADELPDLRSSLRRYYVDRSGAVDDWARQFVGASGVIETHDLLAAMARAPREGFKYIRREEMGVHKPAQTLRLRSGSCRDYALLMMEAARSLGLAARFVPGYLHVHGTPGQMAVGGGSTHAWVEVYIPGGGWVEFDPTNDILGSRDLIRVAVTRDPRQAVPVYGTFDGAQTDFVDLGVDVAITHHQ